MTFAKRIADDAQVQRFIRAISVEFKPGPRKPFKEAHIAVNGVYGSFSGFSDNSKDVAIVYD